MARDNLLQQKKRQHILDYFRELDAAQEFGHKKYTTSYCINKTAEKFFLKPRTIERYVYNL